MTNPEQPHEISDEGEASEVWNLQTLAQADYLLDNLGYDRGDAGQEYREYHWPLGDFEHEIFLRRGEVMGQKNYVLSVHRHGSDTWDSTYSISGNPKDLNIQTSGIDDQLARRHFPNTKAVAYFLFDKIDKYLAASEVDFPQSILQKPVSTYVPQELADSINGVMVEMMAKEDLVRDEVLSGGREQRPISYSALIQTMRQKYMMRGTGEEDLLRRAISLAEQTYESPRNV